MLSPGAVRGRRNCSRREPVVPRPAQEPAPGTDLITALGLAKHSGWGHPILGLKLFRNQQQTKAVEGRQGGERLKRANRPGSFPDKSLGRAARRELQPAEDRRDFRSAGSTRIPASGRDKAEMTQGCKARGKLPGGAVARLSARLPDPVGRSAAGASFRRRCSICPKRARCDR